MVLAFTSGSLLAQRLHVRNFTSDQGLPASQTWTIGQDRSGAIWIGTSGGISRFDGAGFTNFGVSDGVPDALVRAFVEAPDGNLWFGTNGGIVEFDGKSFRTSRDGRPFPRDEIWDALVDGRGRLWFASQRRGIHMWDGSAFRDFGKSAGLPSDYAYALHEDRNGHLWVGTRGNGVAELDVSGATPRVLRVLTSKDGLAGDSVRAIAEDSRGWLYFGTREGGVSVFDGAAFSRIRELDAHGGRDVYALQVNSRGELVVGSVDGGTLICSLDRDSCRAYDRRNGLLGENVYAVFEDRDGVLWLGLNNGVSQIVSEAFANFGRPDGLPDDSVQGIFVDPDDSVWFATYSGLAHCSFATVAHCTTFDENSGLPSRSVWDVVRSRDGSLWVGTRGGLARLRSDGRFDVYTRADGLPADYIYDIFEARDGRLWVATLDGPGIVTLRDGVPRFELPESAGLRGRQIYTTAEDRAGRLWIGTAADGIAVYDNGTTRHIRADDGLGSNAVNAIVFDRNGNAWVGTGGGGLSRIASLDPLRLQRFGAESGLHSDLIVGIREDAQGKLWIGSAQGVDVLDPAAGRSDGGRGSVVRHLHAADGLVSSEMLTNNAIAFDSRQRIWLAFSRGVSRLDPSRELPSPGPPSVTVLSVASTGRETWLAPFTTTSARNRDTKWLLTEPVVVPHQADDLHFEFVAISSADPRGVQYQTRLAGFDRDWSAPGLLRFKDYTNLGPGTYRFQVRARIAGGPWSRVAEVPVEILTPWWMTWPFRIAIIAAVILAIVALHRLRVARIKQQNRQLEGLVADRTEEIAAYASRLREEAHKLQVANEEIQRADRMKSQFLATMSHELRTPLNSIIGFADILRTRLHARASDREMQFLDNIGASGRHLLELINNVLDLAKIEAGKMDVNFESVTARDLLESVRSLAVGMAMSKRIEIKVRNDDGDIIFRADPARIRQVMVNLVSNAIKFSPDGRSVEIAAAGVPAEASELGRDSVALTVTDHGVGIAPEELGRIFEEFEQGRDATRRSTGTGLGLAIVRRLIDSHGGRVFVESRLGHGSTFRVVLPRDPDGRLEYETQRGVTQ